MKLNNTEKDILLLLLNSPWGEPETTRMITTALFYVKHSATRDNPFLGRPGPLRTSVVSTQLRRMERKGLLEQSNGFCWGLGPMVDNLKESEQLIQIYAPENDPWRRKGHKHNPNNKVWRFVSDD